MSHRRTAARAAVPCTNCRFRFARKRPIRTYFQPRGRALSTSQFVSAKHAPPACLTQLVERRNLLATISRQRSRLVLVQAPAGYGKTTLLAQWRELALARGARVAWLGLERSDDTAERFVATLASALAHAGVDLPDELRRESAPGRPDARLDALLRQCERQPRETWVVMDDWHLAASAEVTALVDHLLRRMPANWHLALSSRSRPKLRLLAYRAQGQLLEFGRDELRFALADTRALLDDATITDGALAELTDITEGWPIAVQASRLWLGDDGDLEALRSSFVGSIDGMAEYLAAEVFTSLSPAVREFLVETSICSRFNSDLADRVRQRTDSAELIASVKAMHGLAIPLDGQGQWHRHHRIFAEFLEGERRRLPPARLAALHRCAADWFEVEGVLLEAVRHARLGGDEARAAALIEGADCVDVCLRFGAPAARTLLDSLPAASVKSRLRLRAAQAAISLKLGSIADAGQILADLRPLAADSTDPALRRDVMLVAALRECFIDTIPSADELAVFRDSLRALPGTEWWVLGLMHNVAGRLELRRGLIEEAARSLIHADTIFERGGSAHGHFFMLANIAVSRLFLGRLADAALGLGEARRVLSEGLEMPESYAGVTQTVEAVLSYERNELAEAARAAELAFAGLERAEGCFEQYFLTTLVAARTAFAAEGFDAATRMIARGRRLARFHGLPRVEALLDWLDARLLIDAGRADEAVRLLAGRSEAADLDDGGWLESDHALPVLCLLALDGGETDDARALAATMAARCREGARRPAEIRAHLLGALAATAGGDDHAATALVRDAVRLAAGETIRQPFFELGSALLVPLRELQRQADDLLPAEEQFVAEVIVRLSAATKAQAHVESLTRRERDILAQLRPGRSNKMIARNLALSESAVKFHLKNVFRKLDVDNRAVAAEIAQRLP